MSPQILSLIVFAENIHLNLNQPTEIVVCAPALRLIFYLGKKKNSREELIKISKIEKFGYEML